MPVTLKLVPFDASADAYSKITRAAPALVDSPRGCIPDLGTPSRPCRLRLWYTRVVLEKDYPMSVEIPTDLQPAIEAVVASGVYANEQELVSDILRAVVPALGQYQQLRRDVQASLDEVQQGKVRNAEFDAVRQQLCKEYDESGNRR